MKKVADGPTPGTGLDEHENQSAGNGQHSKNRDALSAWQRYPVRLAAPVPNLYSERVPKHFLIIGVFFALAYAVVVPPFQVPDEDRHLWRAYSVSDGDFVAPAQTQLPSSFLSLHDRFPPKFEKIAQKRVVHAAELMWWLRRPLRDHSKQQMQNAAGNLYSFVPYTAVSIVLRIGKLLGCSPLAMIYAGRLANAAIYLWLLYLSLKLLPEFRLLLFTVALSPMSLHQAASISADSLTLGLAAVLTAFVFKLAWDENVTTVSRTHRLLLVLLLVALALCKFNVWTALLVLLIPKAKFGSHRKALAFAGACVLAACIASTAWQAINSSAISAFSVARAATSVSMAGNAAFLVHHSFRFLEIVLFNSACFSWVWLNEFIGFLGWLTIPLNPLLVLAYFAAIILAASVQSRRLTITRMQKLILLLFPLLTMFSLHVLLWVFETHTAHLREAFTGPVLVRGVQGRYFLPLALPALAAAIKRPFDLNGRLVVLVLTIVVVVNAMALLTVWRVYS